MGHTSEGSAFVQDGTRVERISDRELVVTRTFDAPPSIVFQAWSRPELFMRWWAPKSMGVPIRACEMDVRTGGSYRIEFGEDESQSWAFFGKYVEVVPDAKLVWTNEEGPDGALSTVTFADAGAGRTLLTFSDLYPSKEAFEEAFVGMESAMPEQFEQLDALLASQESAGLGDFVGGGVQGG